MKVLAYYLPQYHRVPINDKWWGEGFTEWTSVKKSQPLYEKHYQPHVPLGGNYYNLLEKETMIWQAELMHNYCIDGMCFYHYWFSDKERVLEKPAENLLMWTDVNMPFCFSWANESWLNKWSHREGLLWAENKEEKNKELEFIFLQTYGREKEWENHFNYLYPFFNDERYIKIDNKPLFVIHDLYNIPCCHEMIVYWNELAKNKGLKGIYILGGGFPDVKCNVDGYMTHEPGMIRNSLKSINFGEPTLISYKDAVDEILAQKNVKEKQIVFTTFCSYDTTPRYGLDGDVYEGATPDLFMSHLMKLMAKNQAAGMDMVFIDAWNEWGEGMHLEPDEKYGYAWLEAVKNAKERYIDYVEKYKKEISYYSEKEFKIICNSKKWELYTSIFDRWMNLREKNINISDYLKKNHFNRIMLYGVGIFSEHMILECKKNDVSVIGIIDRSKHFSVNDIEVYQMSNDLPNVDVIVVTAIYSMDDICNEIRKYNKEIKILSLLELILFAEETFLIDNKKVYKLEGQVV